VHKACGGGRGDTGQQRDTRQGGQVGTRVQQKVGVCAGP
jgi:hypothetical protein